MKPGQHRSEAGSVHEVGDGERRLAAIAYTDVVGYSGVVHRDERLGQKMLERQSSIVRAVLPRFGGREVRSTGDGFLLEFGSALSAVQALAVIQARIATDEDAADCPVTLRTSVHLGDVDHVEGDVFGDGVSIAARLLPLSPERGIAISDVVQRQVRQQLSLPLRSIGAQQLKDIDAPLEVFVADADGLQALGQALLAERKTLKVETPSPAPPVVRRGWLRPVGMLVAAVVVLAGVAMLALRHGGGGIGAADVSDKSIAVLPFTNLSSDKEQEYFSDGIAEDLLNLLTKIQTLQVAARTSSFSFKGKNATVPEIAKALQVAHLLEGSVRKSGNAVRISAQLVRGKDGFQIWSQSWDRQLDDVFKIQDEIAHAVVEQLKIRLLAEAPTARPVDTRAYPLLLQAQALMYQFTPESLAQSVAINEQALEIAPEESRAWAALARSLVNQVVLGTIDPSEGAQRIREAANKALEIDPANVTALVSLGFVFGDVEHDLPASAQHLQRAHELEPGNVMSLNQMAVLLMNIGRAAESVKVFEYRLSHDPANPSVYGNIADSLYFARRWQDTIEASRAALRLAPDYPASHYTIGMALLLGANNAAGALKEFEAETYEAARLLGTPIALHALGRSAEAEAALRVLVEKLGETQPLGIAMAHARLGHTDAAFEWLDKAITARDAILPTALTEPLLDSLHDDPRWLPFLRRIGYAPEQLAKIQLKVALPSPTVSAGR